MLINTSARSMPRPHILLNHKHLTDLTCSVFPGSCIRHGPVNPANDAATLSNRDFHLNQVLLLSCISQVEHTGVWQCIFWVRACQDSSQAASLTVAANVMSAPWLYAVIYPGKQQDPAPVCCRSLTLSCLIVHLIRMQTFKSGTIQTTHGVLASHLVHRGLFLAGCW